jgi:hypothetical protein
MLLLGPTARKRDACLYRQRMAKGIWSGRLWNRRAFQKSCENYNAYGKEWCKNTGKGGVEYGSKCFRGRFIRKNVKEAAKSRVNETADALKQKAVNKFQNFQQTGNGKRARTKTAKNTTKKRKASPPGVRSKLVKKRKTTQVQDIFS